MDQEGQEDAENSEDALVREILLQQEAAKKFMSELLTKAKQVIELPEEYKNVTVSPKLKDINQIGTVLLEFEPKIVAIPNNWEKLWDLDLRGEMSLKDREAFED